MIPGNFSRRWESETRNDRTPKSDYKALLLRDANKQGRLCLTATSPKGHGHGGVIHQLPASLVRTLLGDNNLLTLQPAVCVCLRSRHRQFRKALRVGCGRGSSRSCPRSVADVNGTNEARRWGGTSPYFQYRVLQVEIGVLTDARKHPKVC